MYPCLLDAGTAATGAVLRSLLLLIVCIMSSVGSSAYGPLLVAAAGEGSLEHWEKEVMAAEAEISALMLQVSATRVRLAFAKNQHRRAVLAALAPRAEPLPEEDVREILATQSAEDEAGGEEKEASAPVETHAKKRKICSG